MTKIQLTKMDGNTAEVIISDYDASNGVRVSVITREFTISDAQVITESDKPVYAEALKTSAALVCGRVEGEETVNAFIRLDELNYLKIKKIISEELSMDSEYAGEVGTARR